MTNHEAAMALIKAILDQRNPEQQFGYAYDAGYLRSTIAGLTDIPGVLERLHGLARIEGVQ